MLKLNCDLGESFGAWQMGQDVKVMPLIDQANIACGMHASDPVTLLRTVRLAIEHKVEIGAHPGYPDKEGFGRRAMALAAEEVYALMMYQIAALDGVAKSQGGQVGYVKPHGALYHAMMNDKSTRQAIMHAVSDYPGRLSLVMLATGDYQRFEQEAETLAGGRLALRFEAFADRAYSEDGQLIPRGQSGAVHHELARVVAQADQIAAQGKVITNTGKSVKLPAQTLCVHGDNDTALAAVKAIRIMLAEHSTGV